MCGHTVPMKRGRGRANYKIKHECFSWDDYMGLYVFGIFGRKRYFYRKTQQAITITQ